MKSVVRFKVVVYFRFFFWENNQVKQVADSQVSCHQNEKKIAIFFKMFVVIFLII